jgi:exodeoxyribonuclease VII large subunit
MAAVNDLSRRHVEAALRLVDRRRSDLRATARALPSAESLFSPKRQRLDLAATKLYPALSRNARGHEERLLKVARQLAHVSPVANVARMRARLDAVGPRPHNAVCRSILLREESLKQIGRRLVVSRETLLRTERTRLVQASDLARRIAERLAPALQGQVARKIDRLEAVSKLFDSLSYKSVLKRGFALVRDAEGRPLNAAGAIQDGQALVLEFADGKADATGGRIGTRPRPAKPRIVVAEEQGALF